MMLENAEMLSVLLKAVQKAIEGYDVYLVPKRKYVGVCEFRDDEIHPNIRVFPGNALCIMNRKYSFSGCEQWAIINKFLRSIKKGEDNTRGHYPVSFTTEEFNKCQQDCRALVKDFIERQTAAHRVRNHVYEPYARFMVEKL